MTKKELNHVHYFMTDQKVYNASMTLRVKAKEKCFSQKVSMQCSSPSTLILPSGEDVVRPGSLLDVWAGLWQWRTLFLCWGFIEGNKRLLVLISGWNYKKVECLSVSLSFTS